MIGSQAHCRGMTMVELVVVLAVAGILMGGGAFALSRFGTRNRIDAEAGKVVDALWKMRARATTGMRNPCMDFPSPDSVRLYSDTSSSPDGFGAGDRILGGFRYRGGVRALDIAGGEGAHHAVCFESRGMIGSTTKALLITLGIDGGNPETKRVRLLPSTGVAKVL